MKLLFAVLTLSLISSTTWARASVLKMSEAQKVLVETVAPGKYRQADCLMTIENTADGVTLLMMKKGRAPIMFPLLTEFAEGTTIHYVKVNLTTTLSQDTSDSHSTLTISYQRAGEGDGMSVEIKQKGAGEDDRSVRCDFTAR